MAVLLRKINQAKWNQRNLETESVSADAITNCLKTYQNTLSVWFDDDDEAPNNAKLALAASLERLDAIDYVVLNTKDLAQHGILIAQTPGSTLAHTLVNNHRDLTSLGYNELGTIAELIKAEIVSKRVIRIPKGDLKKMINDAVNKDQIDKIKAEERWGVLP